MIQEGDDPYPTLWIKYRPYNACSIPAENSVEWQSGKVLVDAYELVGSLNGGCPSGDYREVHQYVLLDRFADGDAIYVNGELQFKAIDNLHCFDYTYGRCPASCVKQCTPSISGEGIRTADCDGPRSCYPPSWDQRRYEPVNLIGDNPKGAAQR